MFSHITMAAVLRFRSTIHKQISLSQDSMLGSHITISYVLSFSLFASSSSSFVAPVSSKAVGKLGLFSPGGFVCCLYAGWLRLCGMHREPRQTACHQMWVELIPAEHKYILFLKENKYCIVQDKLPMRQGYSLKFQDTLETRYPRLCFWRISELWIFEKTPTFFMVTPLHGLNSKQVFLHIQKPIMNTTWEKHPQGAAHQGRAECWQSLLL